MVIVTIIDKKGQNVNVLEALKVSIACKDFYSALDTIERYVEKHIDRNKYRPEFNNDSFVLTERDNKQNQLIFKIFEQMVVE